MEILYFLLFAGACVCFALGAMPSARRNFSVNLVALGLLLFALVPALQMLVSIE